MDNLQYMNHFFVCFREDVVVRDENIETNIKELEHAEEIYDYIKNFLLDGLNQLQIDALNNSRNKETIRYKSFRNNVLDIINNQELSEEYLNRFKQDQNGQYWFAFWDNKKSLPLVVLFSRINQRFLGAQNHGRLNGVDVPVIELSFIDNDKNEFSLQTIKAVLDHKSTIIHEITHAFDYVKSNGKTDEELNSYSYYRRPTEEHAFIQQVILWIQTNFDSWKDFEEKIGEVSPDNIRRLIDYLLKSDDIRDDEKFYNEKDYYRFSLKNKFQHLSSKAKKRVYSKIAEYLQFNKDRGKKMKESFEELCEYIPWD